MASRGVVKNTHPVDYKEVGHFVVNPGCEDRFTAPYYYDVLLHEHAGENPMYFDHTKNKFISLEYAGLYAHTNCTKPHKDAKSGENTPKGRDPFHHVPHHSILKRKELVSASVFVSGLPEDLRKADLEKAFSRYGEIRCVFLNRGANWGVVDFVEVAQAKCLVGRSETGAFVVPLQWRENEHAIIKVGFSQATAQDATAERERKRHQAALDFVGARPATAPSSHLPRPPSGPKSPTRPATARHVPLSIGNNRPLGVGNRPPTPGRESGVGAWLKMASKVPASQQEKKKKMARKTRVGRGVSPGGAGRDTTTVMTRMALQREDSAETIDGTHDRTDETSDLPGGCFDLIRYSEQAPLATVAESNAAVALSELEERGVGERGELNSDDSDLARGRGVDRGPCREEDQASSTPHMMMGGSRDATVICHPAAGATSTNDVIMTPHESPPSAPGARHAARSPGMPPSPSMVSWHGDWRAGDAYR